MLSCLFSLLRISRGQNQMYTIWASIGRLWGKICFHSNSGCWQNSAPCGCRTEVPISLLVVTWSYSQLLEAVLIPWLMAHSSSSEVIKGRSNLSYALTLFDLSFFLMSLTSLFCCIALTVPPSSSIVRVHVIILGPPGKFLFLNVS